MKTSIPSTNLTQSLAAVSGAAAATFASAQASTVQITLTGNRLTSTSNTLNWDVTGDGTDDITLANAQRRNSAVQLYINGNPVYAAKWSGVYYASAKFANSGLGVDIQVGENLQNAKYLNPINFTDARINGGASTRGYLEVNAFNTSRTSQTVALTRLVFDNASTTLGTSGLSTGTTYTEWSAVPEPSSLGLLALGAGGLVARRRRQAA